MSDQIDQQISQPYKYGWVTDIDSDVVPAGLNEDVVRLISEKKGEPDWLLVASPAAIHPVISSW